MPFSLFISLSDGDFWGGGDLLFLYDDKDRKESIVPTKNK
ncbi:hypothetical protein HMPREF0758_2744 [Serratia odorifera DSM 4582]|uniref:Uncharacterized protein n=1 Tax=Serratia odorifera DSM 4582 TaxID=667129 RepID=D4E3J4_SEROD|nr:hypothetical protein HMPREF0758_2744 [Serratia odorifera DSM 4582]